MPSRQMLTHYPLHTTRLRRNSAEDIKKLTDGIHELELRQINSSHNAPAVGRATVVLDGMSVHAAMGSAYTQTV